MTFETLRYAKWETETNKSHIRILTEVGVLSSSCAISPVELDPFLGDPVEEVEHVVLWCVVKLSVVGPGKVVLAVHPVRMQLPPVGAEHFGL